MGKKDCFSELKRGLGGVEGRGDEKRGRPPGMFMLAKSTEEVPPVSVVKNERRGGGSSSNSTFGRSVRKKRRETNRRGTQKGGISLLIG